MFIGHLCAFSRFDLGEVLESGATLIAAPHQNGQSACGTLFHCEGWKKLFQNGDWYKYLIPAAEALSDWHTIILSVPQIDEVTHGHRIPAEPDLEPGLMARAISEDGELIALMEYDPETTEWQPRKVFSN